MVDAQMDGGRSDTPFTTVPIEITVSVGRAHPMVKDLLKLSKGSILELDKTLEDPVELFVGNRLIGLGALEVVETGDQSQLAVRLTEVVDLQNPA